MLRLKFVLIQLFCFSFAIFGSGIDQADMYNKNSDLQWEWATTSIQKYPWIGNERILDIGCGDGKVTMQVSEKIPFGMVVGLDISPKMISFASSNFTVSDHRNVLFMQGDVLQLPFKEQFDLVVSFCTLHWVLDQKKALECIEECLLHGGKALLIMPAAAPNNISTQCEKLVCSKKWAPYFPSFTPQRVYYNKNDYEKLIIEAGLFPLSMQVIPSETIYPNKQALINWLKPLVTFIYHLPEATQNEFLEDLATQMLLTDPPAADHSIHINHLKLEVLAIKN